MTERMIGTVTHYYSRIGVAALSLEAPLSKGSRIHIQGPTTDLHELVESMEIGHEQIESARPGDDVAIKVNGKVRDGDRVLIESNGGPASGG